MQPDYKQFLEAVKNHVREAQFKALRSVNAELIDLYLGIGKMIVEKQDELGWGRSIVEQLSTDLQNEFVGVRGFSVSNLWRMRTFYQSYRHKEKLAPLVREIGWSHNVVIFEKCKDYQEREFYLKMAQKYGWTKSVLTHQIETKAFEKFLLNQTNFHLTLPEKYRSQAKLAVKDEYNFDFLEIGEAHAERELEQLLVSNIQKFLLELGGDFAFLGNQYRLEIEGEEFFIDLLLFHRRLQCLVAVELKTTKFKPAFAGQMQFYLSALDEEVKTEKENPSIGIIICKEKNRTVVEYTLKRTSAPIGVAGYMVSDELPHDYQNLLPTSEEIARRLEDLGNS